MIRVSKSCISQDEKRLVNEVLDSEFLGMGTYVAQFEKLLSDYFGRTAVCVNSGTAALQLALEALDIGPGDEVIVPSLTYVASFQAISATGAKPIACDVDDKGLMTVRLAQQCLSGKTKAIMPVHYAGQPCDLHALEIFCKKHNIYMIEDAAHAFGSRYNGKLVGSQAGLTCFSFDGIKNITCGEGGCVVSDDPIVIERIKNSRLLGVLNDSELRVANQRSITFDVPRQGWRYHMSNIYAAIGIQQFNRFDALSTLRTNLMLNYISKLRSNSVVDIILSPDLDIVPHIFPVLIKSPFSRDSFRDYLLSNDIQTSIHYQPNHYLSLYQDSSRVPLTNTQDLYSRLLTLPLHPDLTEADLDYIVDIINKYPESVL